MPLLNNSWIWQQTSDYREHATIWKVFIGGGGVEKIISEGKERVFPGRVILLWGKGRRFYKVDYLFFLWGIEGPCDRLLVVTRKFLPDRSRLHFWERRKVHLS